MRFSEKQAIFLRNFALLILYINSNKNWYSTAGELLRTVDQQRIYLKTGYTRTLKSLHLIKMAGDLNIFIYGIYANAKQFPDEFRKIGEYWQSINKANEWGGRFGVEPRDYKTKIGWDPAHFQMNPSTKLDD